MAGQRGDLRPRGRRVLTDVLVRQARAPAAGRLVLWDSLVVGFGLQVTATGARSYVLKTRLRDGRHLRLTWRVSVGLSAARELARNALRAVAQGEDPRVAQLGPEAHGVTVAEAAADYLAQRQHLRTAREIERRLQVYVLPTWGTRPLRSITRRDVVHLGDGVRERHGGTMANRVATTVKALLAWALDRDLIDVHPAARLRLPAPERSRDRVLTDDELRVLWIAWGVLGWPFGTALKILLLTGCRRSEVGGMRHVEVDLDAALWTVPAARVKSGATHLVPLAPMVVDILSTMPRMYQCPWAFSTTGRGPIRDWSNAVSRMRALSGVTDVRVHDLRRTMRSGLSRLGVHFDVAELCIGHRMRGVAARYDRYDRLAERRDALERWGAHVHGIVGP
jgi:integrase